MMTTNIARHDNDDESTTMDDTNTNPTGSSSACPSSCASLVGMTKNAEECREVYDSWAAEYEKDVKAWGYDAPTRVANLLAKHLPRTTKMILDAGAGDGLSGLALRRHFAATTSHIIGADLSSEMLQIANQRGCYTSTEQVDLNQIPYPFYDDTFDAVTCVGTMTYIDPTKALGEFCRIIKSGGYICYTNRTDKLEGDFDRIEKRLVDQGQWRLIGQLGPLPYLPNHTDFTDQIQIMIYLFQIN